MIRRIFWSSYTIVALIMLGLGLIIGFTINDFPAIEFDNKLKIYEVFNLFLTVVIAVSIPFVVKKTIDDKRAIKAYISEEVKATIIALIPIKDMITNCYHSGTFSREEKDKLLLLFNNLEFQINSLSEQFLISFKNESKEILNELKNEYFLYDRFVTNDELMSEGYSSIDPGFYRDHKANYSKLELKLKTTIHKVNCF